MQILNKIIIAITSMLLNLSPGTSYKEGVVGQPRSFLPHQTETQTDRTISSLIYRGLLKYDIYGALVPDLAESYEISEDGLVYTMTLKENQKWSDGSKITSEDLIYTSFKTPVLSGVATDRVDDRTVRYTLPNKFSPFLSLLTRGVMKNNSEEGSNALQPISNGQFKVISVKKSGPTVKEVVLSNSSKTDHIDKLVFRYYANASEQVTAAKLGEIDAFVTDLEVDLKNDLTNFENFKFPVQSVYYSLMFNLREAPLDNLEFREKLRASLPVEELTAPYGIPVQGVISKSPFSKNSIETDHFDKDLPEEIRPESLVIKVPNIKRHVELARRIDNVWEDKFNISVDVDTVPPEEMLESIINARDFDVLLYGQEVGRDPDRYVYWHSTQKDAPNLNLTGFEQVRADRALEEGRNSVDLGERMTHYNEFQGVIEREVPAIFLYHPYKNYYVSKYFSGIGEKYTFTVGDRFLDFMNWKKFETN